MANYLDTLPEIPHEFMSYKKGCYLGKDNASLIHDKVMRKCLCFGELLVFTGGTYYSGGKR